MEKVVRDGHVAVLVSPGYGAGWFSWHNREELLFHPELICLVEENKQGEITEDLCKRLIHCSDDESICVLGAEDLIIEWIPVGTAFQIHEYDGAESIQLKEHFDWIVA